MMRYFPYKHYVKLTEEQKILFVQEDNDGCKQHKNIISDETGLIISFSLFVYKNDREFYEKYKLFFNEEDIKKEFDMLMRSEKWKI